MKAMLLVVYHVLLPHDPILYDELYKKNEVTTTCVRGRNKNLS